ncbi:hypothetical protein GCM10008995_26750 [Halobellus salinus]|uniref:2Fe-2S ferredoxin-type domain-containing protein n=1 Tax=Halobellus salinus TaxID=931585 RepID=A0A830ER30_9EURY|nr:2Fe-2S iron-sulfur cluster-binding protein [Halobellus salinus]GGJ15586.1 hypothetical protein GCM10008995_26750 [Halobellus salinus]SMP32975.1 Ferredoxin [Halobellus salinus]
MTRPENDDGEPPGGENDDGEPLGGENDDGEPLGGENDDGEPPGGENDSGEPLGDGQAGRVVELVWPAGRAETLRVRGDESIVDAAETAGVAVPYGCLYGACGTCTAELLNGELRHTDPPRALKDRSLDVGYVLPCIGTPETDCRLRVGHEIQAEVVGTPWK